MWNSDLNLGDTQGLRDKCLKCKNSIYIERRHTQLTLVYIYVILHESSVPQISTSEVVSAKLEQPIESQLMGNTPGWSIPEFSNQNYLSSAEYGQIDIAISGKATNILEYLNFI